MKELDIINLYDNADENLANNFSEKLNSQMRVKTDYYKKDNDLTWLDEFEKVLPYLEKIFKNPKRFIITEEEILKIESTKRVGVETVKHLAKHTNYIQDLDEEGDVLPSKLLNVNKEETFNTYENRFVYTLVIRMEEFIKKKLDNIVQKPKLKDNKNIEYTSTTMVGEEQVDVNINLKTHLDTNLEVNKKLYTRIKNIQDLIKDLKYSELYRALEKEDVPLVIPPIKKTNVILKNVNFQYAVKLWNYLQEHVNDDSNSETKDNNSYDDKGELKRYFDESFLLDYLVSKTLTEFNNKKLNKDKISERLIGNVVEKIIDINAGISKEQLSNLVARQYTVIKYRNVVTDKKITKIYREAIDKYLKKISNLTME